MAGLGMEPMRLEPDLGAWRTEGSGKGVAMAGAATLQLGDAELAPERPFSLRWVWRWRSVAGQVVEFDRLVAVARGTRAEDDPAPRRPRRSARSRTLGWRAVLAAHEAAWDARWAAGDDRHRGRRRPAAGGALRRLSPDQRRQSRRRAGLDRCPRPHRRRLFRARLLGHRDLSAAVLHRGLAGGGASAADVPLPHAAGARAKAAQIGCKGALYAWESADTGDETTPEHVVGARRLLVDILSGRMEQHVSADIAYAVWQYWRATGDDDFFLRPARRSCWRRPGFGRRGPCRRRTDGGTSATSSGRTNTTRTSTTTPSPT